MNKLLIILASVLSGDSLWLAHQAVDDVPTRVEVAGRQLRMRVEGNASPTVVLEIGLGGMLEEWAAVQPNVAKFARVAAYDRTSAMRDKSMLTGEDVARELHAALAKADLKPPYVLVGQSFGGVYIRVFASLYPNEVAGLVLLDPSQEEFIDWMHVHHPEKDFKAKDLSDWPELAGIRSTLNQLKTAGPLPNVPTVVVTAARPSIDPLWIEVAPVWKETHIAWAKTLPQGWHVLDPESGHGIQVEDPVLVIDLIREVVDKSRKSTSPTTPPAR